jgi:putative NADPH-quinone reductase
MARRITILQGHPDARGNHFGHALAAAYAHSAKAAGHEVTVIEVAQLDFPLLRNKEDWESGTLPQTLRQAQQAIGWAEHLVILYPLLKAFLEQVFRPGFALPQPGTGQRWKKLLTGKTARIVITMVCRHFSIAGTSVPIA